MKRLLLLLLMTSAVWGQGPKKQFLITLKLVKPELIMSATPEEKKILADHVAHLKVQNANGLVVFAARTLELDPTGLVIVQAADETEAQTVIDKDPAIKAGIFKGTLAPLQVVIKGPAAAAKP